MNIELIIPPNPYLGDDMRNVPLGLLYVAAAVKPYYNVRINDLRSKTIDEFESLIGDADIYGITASTPDYLLAVDIAKIIKNKHSKSWVVLGGIHASALPYKIDQIFDKVVIGEGEKSILKIIEDYKNGDNSNRYYQAEFIQNIDEILQPARELLPFNSVFSNNAFAVNDEPAGTLITSRGCPSRCSFCASQVWKYNVRFRSPNNVYNEIHDMISKYGIKKYRFQDDTMTLKRDRLKELCELIAPLNITWRTTTRVDQSDIERLKMLKDAGCEEVGFGIESLDNNVLKKNAKGTNLKQIYEAMKNTKDIGLKTRLFFIIGLPGETPGYTDRLEKFLNDTSPDGIDVSTLVPYPGTDIYNNPDKFNIKLKHDKYDIYHMTLGLRDNEIDRPLTFIHDVLSEDEIISERKKSLELIKNYKLIKNY